MSEAAVAEPFVSFASFVFSPLAMTPYERIDRAIDEASADLRALSLDIHAHPELNFEEVHTYKVLADYLDSEGFEVVRLKPISEPTCQTRGPLRVVGS